jgi:ankyrin repeat protein
MLYISSLVDLAKDYMKVGELLRRIVNQPIVLHEPSPAVRQKEFQDKDDSQAKRRFRGSTKRTKSVAVGHNHPIIRPQPLLHKTSISDYQLASSACEAGCICKCHAPHQFKILGHSYLLGSLSITISASSGNKSLCTETSCSRRSMSVARATYRFPIWLLARILCLTVSVQPQNGLNASLKTPRVVPDNADIMHFAKIGDLDGVRSLIEQRLASPLDVNATWNVPVLSVSNGQLRQHLCKKHLDTNGNNQYAVQGHHTELCQLLLDEGADPCVENRSNVSVTPLVFSCFGVLTKLSSALDRAWDIVLAQNVNTQTGDKIRSIFSLQYDSVWFEEQQFTTLHKIIFRSIGRDIRAELQLSTAAINQKDSKGRTPLAWASARGDEQYVRTLLEFGADPNISCAIGNSPLLRSVQARSSKCIRLLLDHGADIRSKNNLGFTALHYAAYYKDDEAYLTPLLDFGLPIDEKDDYGWTALAATAEYDHVRSATVLLHRGADIETRDKNGWTPLLRAVNSNSHGVLELLLGRGADHHAVSFRNETILYFAASRGDYKTLDILTRAALEDLDPNTKDSKGQRATDIIKLRSPQPSQLVAAFDSLIESLR